MANKSDLTRKELVLRYLQGHPDWVDGPDLANERVGGSEGLKRVRELRAEGHRIITRPHPDRSRDVFQYKLIKPESIAPVIQERLDQMLYDHHDAPKPLAKVTEVIEHPDGSAEIIAQPITPGMAGRSMPMRRTDDGLFELTKEVCVECGGMYDDDLEHRTTDTRHLRWMEAQQANGQQTIGVPEQPPPYRFTRMPEKIEMGKVLTCPRCGGKRRMGRTYYSRKKGEVITTAAEDFTRDPFKPTIKGEANPCIRCGGFGIVPQYVEEGDVAVQPIHN